MVYVVLTVVLSTTSGGSIAALFGEALALAHLLSWATILAISGVLLRDSGALTGEVVLEVRMTIPEAGMVASLLIYFLVIGRMVKNPTSSALAEGLRDINLVNYILFAGYIASTKTRSFRKVTASRCQESNGGSVQLVPIITEGPKSMLNVECVRRDGSGQEVLHLTLDITADGEVSKKAVVFASGFGGKKFALGNASDAAEFVHLKSGELEEVGGSRRVLEVYRGDPAIVEGVENRRQAEDDHQTWAVGDPAWVWTRHPTGVVSPSDAEGLVLSWVPCPDRRADERDRHMLQMECRRQRAAAAAAAAAVAAAVAALAAAAAAADRAAVAAAVAVAAPVAASSEIKNPVANSAAATAVAPSAAGKQVGRCVELI
jgi:hypothetical protein